MHVAMQLDSVTASSWLQMLPPFILTACCHTTDLNIFFPPFWVSLHLACKQQDDCLLYQVQTRKGVDNENRHHNYHPALQPRVLTHNCWSTKGNLFTLLQLHNSNKLMFQTDNCWKSRLDVRLISCELPAHLRPVTRDQCKEKCSELPCSQRLLD